MENHKEDEEKKKTVTDFYIPKITSNKEKKNTLSEDSDIQWHQDGKTFDTIREAHEWAYNVIYNEIGNLYGGYKTTDEKIAYSLVYELVRSNTFYGQRYNVYSDYEKEASNLYIYKVWVTPLKIK